MRSDEVKSIKQQSAVEARNYLNKFIVGNSPAMMEVKGKILLVARSNSTVLVTGESGTGKELIAKAIHDLSSRSSGPYIAINCGACTESLLESELFGHIKGSFTGATGNAKGHFQSANGGTIFLDEVAEMSPAMQVKLLRVLQEHKVRPVGLSGEKEISVNTRVIAATNKDMLKEVRAGRFREDLYYRLKVMQVYSPPLRNRVEDIPQLVPALISKLSEDQGINRTIHFSRRSICLLQRYEWPGNVRELENFLHLLLVTYDGRVTLPMLKQHLQLSKDVANRKNELEKYMQEVELANGCYRRAAMKLNMNRTALYMKIKRLQEKCYSAI